MLSLGSAACLISHLPVDNHTSQKDPSPQTHPLNCRITLSYHKHIQFPRKKKEEWDFNQALSHFHTDTQTADSNLNNTTHLLYIAAFIIVFLSPIASDGWRSHTWLEIQQDWSGVFNEWAIGNVPRAPRALDAATHQPRRLVESKHSIKCPGHWWGDKVKQSRWRACNRIAKP